MCHSVHRGGGCIPACTWGGYLHGGVCLGVVSAQGWMVSARGCLPGRMSAQRVSAWGVRPGEGVSAQGRGCLLLREFAGGGCLLCARFPKFMQNCSEHSILWSFCSVDFLTFTLKLAIQSLLSVAPKLQVFACSREKCQKSAKQAHPLGNPCPS